MRRRRAAPVYRGRPMRRRTNPLHAGAGGSCTPRRQLQHERALLGPVVVVSGGLTDPENAALAKDQLLYDDQGQDWCVVHAPVLDDDRRGHFVTVRRGAQVVRLTDRNAYGWRPEPAR